MATTGSILFVDAYDSFSQNIIALLHQELGADISLVRIDTDIEETFGLCLNDFLVQFDAVVLGPGPGNPNDSKDVGIFADIINTAAAAAVPLLGICLGFQVLCVKYGLRVGHMERPCHGHSKKMRVLENNLALDGNCDIFQGLDVDNIWATCYNSLGLTLTNALITPSSSRPGSSGTNTSFSTTSSQNSSETGAQIRVLAIDTEDNVMAVKHQKFPFHGVQFHPESCKSNHACHQVVSNWWVAAQKHNQKVRQSHDTATRRNTYTTALPPGRLQFPDGNASKSATRSIISQLATASTTSTNKVQWRQVESVLSREQISRIVNNMAGDGDVAMLESTKKGRFSIYAVTSTGLLKSQHDHDPYTSTAWKLQYRHSELSITRSNAQIGWFTSVSNHEIVWDALESFLTQKKATGGPADVPFWGGFMGYLSYEHGLRSIGVNSQPQRSQSVPEMSFIWVERSVIYDNLSDTIYVQSIRENDDVFLNTMATHLSTRPVSCPTPPFSKSCTDLQRVLSSAKITLPDQAQYHSRFHQCQVELHAGNSYELCLTTEAVVSIAKPATAKAYEFELYQNLHARNPVPFGAFFKLAGTTILGTSPEQYMSWSRDGVIDMIPMKGTVKRSADMTFERASTILSSAKESAENLMIADLIRHDLFGALGHDAKVEVVKLCEVVEHETVYQLISHIRAHAPVSKSLSDGEKQEKSIHYGLQTLRQTVPPGSMTGAPKKRSCEILSQLEQRNRGVYSGVLGYMDVGGGGNWNVCIRTAFRSQGEGKTTGDRIEEHDIWHLGAGGAITVLSDVEGEWQEMMLKLNSVLQGFKTVKS